MKSRLTILIPLLTALALSCAAPEQPDERLIPSEPTRAFPASALEEPPTPLPTSTPLSNIAPRGGSVRLAGGRSAPVVPVVPRGLIPAVFDPVHILAADVGEQAGEGTPVIGVSTGGESVAYSVAYLSSREIVNDTVGGTPIVVTW